MKILLDECVPLQVRGALADHEVITAQHFPEIRAAAEKLSAGEYFILEIS